MKVNFPELPGMAISELKAVPRPEHFEPTRKSQGIPSSLSVQGFLDLKWDHEKDQRVEWLTHILCKCFLTSYDTLTHAYRAVNFLSKIDMLLGIFYKETVNS